MIDVGVDFLVKAKSVFQLLCLGLALLSADVDKMISCIARRIVMVHQVLSNNKALKNVIMIIIELF